VQAYQLEGAPVYGIQFHPEKNVAAALRAIEYCRAQGRHEALLREQEGESLFDPTIGARIFGNFVHRIS
jgi:GMP synthase-like glutamine amidotransferase